MTCVAGLAQGGVVHIAGDTQASSDGELFGRLDEKTFRNGEYIIGFAGSYRVGQVVRYMFDPPVYQAGLYDDVHEFMVTRFVPVLIKVLKDADALGSDRPHDLRGSLLIGLRGKLFTLDDDFQVGVPREQWDAIGSGGLAARASLYSTNDMLLSPEERVSLAVRTAGYLVADCGTDSFTYLSSQRTD